VTDPVAVLQSEFDAAEGSFLFELRSDLRWNLEAFTRMTTVMYRYASSRKGEADIPRWIARGFWHVESFVRDWSSHPSFPREHEASYYERAYTRLHDLSYLLFHGESPYLDDSALGIPI
jgi:hypothetical protein